MSKLPATLRLDRLLANLGYGSRREVQGLVADGRVRLDNAVLETSDQRMAITPNLSTRMSVDGAPLDPPPGLTLMLHKPLGVVCSHKETGALVYELLPARWRRREPALSTIGRLDKDTSGLLLLTDDGDLLHRVISPRRHVPKRYRVTLARPLRGDEAERFASGTLRLEADDKPLLPAALEVSAPMLCVLTITEGRYHQVRRMFAAVDNHVTALHRDRVGGLVLPDDLNAGSYKVLDETGVAAIFDAAP